MEKRKLLLVAVSVGVFLVIVLSAAVLIFTPGAGVMSGGGLAVRPLQPGQAPSGAAPPRGPASADAADMVRNTGDLQGLLVPPPGAASPVSGAELAGGSGSPVSASAVQENNFYISGQTAAQSSAAERGDPSKVVINVPKPSAPGVPAPAPRPPAETRPAGSGQAASGQNPIRQVPASPARQQTPASGSSGGAASGTAAPPAAAPAAAVQAKPGAPAKPASPSSAPASPATAPAAPAVPAARAAPRSAAVSRAQRDYWIQTGAFSALVRAEDVKETLASKGLSSIIDDGEVDGQTWYRVRVGPYTSENEASYWLALVRAINGFDQSQIRSTLR
jgi:DedD protein